ncbi:MAG: hypothetical protein KDI11_04355 [Alphaproteobacteria bacterium]|nr:hypothetical protein [Alphaproteobacteria bacterium]
MSTQSSNIETLISEIRDAAQDTARDLPYEWSPAEPAQEEELAAQVKEAVNGYTACFNKASDVIGNLTQEYGIGTDQSETQDLIDAKAAADKKEQGHNDPYNGINDWSGYINKMKDNILNAADKLESRDKKRSQDAILLDIKAEFVRIAALAQTAAQVTQERGHISNPLVREAALALQQG